MSAAPKKLPKQGAQQVAPIALPTWQQTMAMALAFIQYSLEILERERLNDEQWADKDIDIDMAAQLTLMHVRHLRANPPATRKEFDAEWFMLTAPINLCVGAFSRPDSAYFRLLRFAQEQFGVLVAAVEFVDEEHRYAD